VIILPAPSLISYNLCSLELIDQFSIGPLYDRRPLSS